MMGMPGMTVKDKKPAMRAIDLMCKNQWAILPEALETIRTIALRENDTPEAVAAKLGRPLQNTRRVTVRDGVAVVPVSGPIFRYANLFTEISGATSIEVLATDFNVALDDPNVKSIVLEIDSPGGEVSGTSEFAEMVARADKEVVAYISDMGASAAYWIASAADRIVIRDTALAGSIGVVTGFYVDKDSRRQEIVSTQSPKKRPDPSTEGGRSQIQVMVDSLADVFISTVANYRGVTVETVMSDFGQGDLFVGQQAVDAGLADETGSLEGVIAGLSGIVNKRGVKAMSEDKKQTSAPEITSEFIARDHPDIAEQFKKDGLKAGYDDAFKAGADAERARILAVEEALMPGCQELINQLKADGKTTGAEAALAVIKHMQAKGVQHLDNLRADAPAPVKLDNSGQDPAAVDSDLPVEERCKAEWDKSAALRKEFSSLTAYVAYTKHNEAGQVKVLKNKGGE